ncbi:MAG: signal peptidase I [Parabacteroides sp.]
MSVKRVIRSFLKWLLIIVLAALLVLALRHFCIGSYQISTDAMKESLQRGDYILVNKLPGVGSPERNSVVLFTSPLQKDSLTAPVLISRVVGMPGDTIHVSQRGYRIGGKLYPRSPKTLSRYQLAESLVPKIDRLMQQFSIPNRTASVLADRLIRQLTDFEAYQIREELTAAEQELFQPEIRTDYTLAVPRAYRGYRLDPFSLKTCREAILSEAEGNVSFRDDKLFLNDKETDFFFFKQDYYWVLSDNTTEAVDSRYVGFIPADHLIGTAFFCWYSTDSKRFFKPID